LTALQPELDMQTLVTEALINEQYGIQVTGIPVDRRAKDNLVKVAQHLMSCGAQVIILGCTELPLGLCKEDVVGEVVLVDPMDVGAKVFWELLDERKSLKI